MRSSVKSGVFFAARRLGINGLLRRASRRRLLVLCYHGVISEDHPEDPLRTRNVLSRRTFVEQLSVLCRLFKPVSAEDVLRFVEGKSSLPDYPLLITFDDGFRNNLTCAAPELRRLGVPALVLITTGHVGQDRLLWTQELDERILGWREKTIPLPDGRGEIDMPPVDLGRAELADRIRGLCKRLPDTARESYLDKLRNEPLPRGEDWHREIYQFLSWDEVRSLCDQGFAIGSHTVGHRILTRLKPDQLNGELSDSKTSIERELGRECPWISYPNGGPEDYSPAVMAAAREVGYRVGFTLTGRRNFSDPPALAIERMCVPDQPANNAFHARVSGLLAIRSMFGG